jgi:Cadherin cytoplasmic region
MVIAAPPVSSQRRQRPPGDYPNVGDLIDDRLRDADADQPPNDDAVHGFSNEGAPSEAGTLSSIGSGSSAGDQDFSYLNNWGPPFRKLADLYGNDEGDEENTDLSNV